MILWLITCLVAQIPEFLLVFPGCLAALFTAVTCPFARRGGLEYEHKAGFGTTETLLETLTEIEPTTPRFHVLVLYHCVTNIGPQKRCLNTDILVQILNGETIFSNNHTLFSIQNCKVTGCNGIITTTEIWRDKQNSYFIIIFCWGGKRSLVPYLTLLKHAKQSQNGVVFIPSLFEV